MARTHSRPLAKAKDASHVAVIRYGVTLEWGMCSERGQGFSGCRTSTRTPTCWTSQTWSCTIFRCLRTTQSWSSSSPASRSGKSFSPSQLHPLTLMQGFFFSMVDWRIYPSWHACFDCYCKSQRAPEGGGRVV
jgi:hypothetical protein